MRALRAASIAMLAPLLCAQTANLNDLLASMRTRVETADFRATGHLVWVQPNGARLSYPITIKAHWFSGVLREYVEVGAATKSPGNAPPGSRLATHALLEMISSSSNTSGRGKPPKAKPGLARAIASSSKALPAQPIAPTMHR